MAAPLSARVRSWLTLAASLAALNLSVTFENIWPTPMMTWRGGLSLELAICILALAAANRMRDPHRRAGASWIAVAWTLLVLGRYGDVTAPALYGRDVNLYWDLRFVPDVVAMVTRVAPGWLIAAAAVVVMLLIALLYGLVRAAWRRVAGAMRDVAERRALLAIAIVTIVLFAIEQRTRTAPLWAHVTTPVTATYARQIRFVIEAKSGSTSLAPSPSMDSDLSRIKGADVFLIFVEAYGATAFDRPDVAAALAASRRRFEADIRDTHRDVVSAFVASPTFGGSSWLAHISFLSGIEVRDPDTNARLMAGQRDTVVRTFRRSGYRTIALMPGLRQAWPEGSFYGFDKIYSADGLAYRGPEFGWFAIPDQFALYRFHEREIEHRARAEPLFVFFPTISTHFPFSPSPPYQPDWRRMATARPYDGPEIVRAYAQEPDWIHFAPGYADAIAYDIATIGGFLRLEAERDLVMIVLGDHQPAAVVSGEGASWDVPVHVIASRKRVLERLLTHGFQPGLVPQRPPLGRMHELLPLLLEAFGERGPRP